MQCEGPEMIKRDTELVTLRLFSFLNKPMSLIKNPVLWLWVIKI